MLEELKDMQENVIEKEVNEQQKFIDPLDTLVNHNFSGDKELNLDESYEMITVLERENKLAKTLEAENIISELEDLYVDSDFKEKLNKSFDNVKSFIKKYNIEKDEIKNMTEEEKTKLFAIGSFINKNVGYLLNELEFSISLTREEYKFVSTAVEQKLSYDGNEVFNIIELDAKYLKKWKEIDKSLGKQVPSFIVNIDIRNVVMLYHFLGRHTVKGLGREFYIFASVLKKIADTNKLYNAYNILKERLSTDFSIWTGAMEPETLQGYVPEQK